MRTTIPLLAAGCLLTFACGGAGSRASGPGGGAPANPPPQTTAPLAAGVWGGDHVTLTITDTGARLQFDCATGAIAAPIVAANGRFDGAGVFTRERPGAQRVGDAPAGAAARYRGVLAGNTMTLEIVLTPSNESVGTFTLERGAMGNVFRCR